MYLQGLFKYIYISISDIAGDVTGLKICLFLTNYLIYAYY